MRQVLLAGLLAVAVSSLAHGEGRRGSPAAFGIEALRDCGPNGFALTGSAGCVRLGGSLAVTTTLRSGGAAAEKPARTPGLFGTHVSGHLAADIRVPTDLGPLRVYTDIRVADPRGLGGAGHSP